MWVLYSAERKKSKESNETDGITFAEESRLVPPFEQDELVFSSSSSDSLRAAPLAHDCALKSSTLKLSFLPPPLNMERSQSR